MNKFSVIGIGCGREDYLLPLAKRAIEEVDCLIGARRILRMFENLNKEKIFLEGDFKNAITYIEKNRARKKIAVLVSGDPGLHSFLGWVSQVFKKEEYVVIPGISTLQIAFAKISELWQDAKIISLHGQKLEGLTDKVRGSSKIFLFTDAGSTPDKIASYLLKNKIDNRRTIVFENLTYPNERIIDTDLENLSKMKGFGLCAMIMLLESKEQRRKNREHRGRTLSSKPKAKLYGIGIGPGDPKLLTIRAKEILDRVETVFIPKANEEGVSSARSIIETVSLQPKDFVELTFPMTKDIKILTKYWKLAAKKIAKELKKKKEVAFVTMGDPFIYSTYIYLLKALHQELPDVSLETVPGISAFNAAACRAQLPLVKGNERLAILPVREDLKGLKKTLKEFDSVVLMKVGPKLDKVIGLLEDLDLIKNSVLISHVGQRDEKVIYNLSSLRGKKAGYLSLIIVKRTLQIQ